MDDAKRHDPLPVIGQAKAPKLRVTSAAMPAGGDDPASPTGGEKHIELSAIHDFAGKLHQEHVLPRLKEYVEWQARLRAALSRPDVTEAELIELVKIPDWAPVSINLDLTTSCNFACDHCVDMEILNTGIKFETDRLMDSLSLMADKGLKSVIIIGGGEPTIHARFGDVVKLLKGRGVQVSVVSNGSGNRKLVEIAPLLEVGDWIRLSLDSGTEETFQAMHKPRKTITLDEICEGVPAIRAAGTQAFKIGFSYIITWRGATIHDNDIVENIGEIVTAARRAKEYGFDYIACKPFLTRAERNNAEIVDLTEVDQQFEEITARIRAAVDEAKELEDGKFRVYETTNLKVLENRSHGDFSTQPHQCHLQFFRQVMSPLGMYNCPVYRNQAHGRLGTKDAYATAADYESTRMSTAELIRVFDATFECKEVTCLYNHANWWIEELIREPGKLAGLEVIEMEEPDYFLWACDAVVRCCPPHRSVPRRLAPFRNRARPVTGPARSYQKLSGTWTTSPDSSSGSSMSLSMIAS